MPTLQPLRQHASGPVMIRNAACARLLLLLLVLLLLLLALLLVLLLVLLLSLVAGTRRC